MNLETNYLGLKLRGPLVIGASPCSDDIEAARRLEDAGAAAIVVPSLFEEQLVEGAPPRSAGVDAGAYRYSPDEYLRQIDRLKRALEIPVIASLNGHHSGSWTVFAEQIERAGADAIEVNFYQVVSSPSVAADQVEVEMLTVIGELRAVVDLPLAAKISPYHASVAQLAVALELAGADGVVVFNRFYEPDISTDGFEVVPCLRLSTPGELLLRLRWLAILSPLLRGSLSVTGGVHTWSGVVKSLLTGAHTVQIVSAVLKHGPQILTKLQRGLKAWMREHRYTQLDQFRGTANYERARDASGYERANYVRVLQSWEA
jgi:dihydroorotate dehydrogenase (fumarate)